MSSSSSSSSWGSWEELLLACAVRRYGPLMWQTIAAEVSKRQLDDGNNSSSFTPKECKCKYDELVTRFKRINGGYEPKRGKKGGGGDCLTRMINELTRFRIQELKFLVRKQDISIKKQEVNLKKLQEEQKSIKPEVDPVGVKEGSRKRMGGNVKRRCKGIKEEEENNNVDRRKRAKPDTDVIEKRRLRPEKRVEKTAVGASNEPKVIVCALMAAATARTPDSAKPRKVGRRSMA